MMHTATIRRATPADAAPLAALKLATFRETFVEGFAIPYPADARARFEAESYGVDVVRADLESPASASWIAEADGRPVGYAAVGPCKLPHPEVEPGAAELRQLYLRREAQGAGLADRLMAQALAHLAATRPGPVWLGVWSGNARAQAYYRRHGFRDVGTYRFPVGLDWYDDELIYRRD